MPGCRQLASHFLSCRAICRNFPTLPNLYYCLRLTLQRTVFGHRPVRLFSEILFTAWGSETCFRFNWKRILILFFTCRLCYPIQNFFPILFHFVGLGPISVECSSTEEKGRQSQGQYDSRIQRKTLNYVCMFS